MEFLSYLISGISLGSVYAIIALGARSMTFRTRYIFLYLDLLLDTCRDLLQVQLHLDTQIRPPIHPTATT